MKWNSQSNRRKGDRRSGDAQATGVEKRQTEQRQTEQRQAERRQAERRSNQRRIFFRVIYPTSAAPKILNTNYRVIDLSSEGIKFVCPQCADGLPQLIKLSKPMDITLQFHNEETIDLQIKILRCYKDDDSDEKCFAAKILTPIPVKKIMEEDAYIRKHFPDFHLTT